MIRLLIALLALTAAFSGHAVTIPEETRSVALWPDFEVLEDPAANLTPAEVAKQPESAWQPLPSRHHHFGNQHSARWARFTITNRNSEFSRWYLVQEQSFVDNVELFRRGPQGQWQQVLGLRDMNTARWFGGARNPAFELELPHGSSAQYLLRVKTLSLQRFPLVLREAGDFRQRERFVYMISGALVAVSLIVALFMFLLWRVQRQRGFLIVTGLILAEMTGAAWVGGVLYTVAPWADPRSLGVIGLASWIAAVCFGFVHARIFLYLDRDAPQLARVFRVMPWLILGTMVFELFGSALGRNLLIYTAFVSLFFFTAASVWQARRGLAYAWVYALAWGTYFGSISLTVLNMAGAIPPNASNLLMFAQGSIVSLLFAIAVVGQLRDQEQRVQASLAASNQRFALAAEGSSVGLFDWDVPQRNLFLSVTAQRLLGIQASAIHPARLLRALAPDARRALVSRLQQAVAGRENRVFVEVLIGSTPIHLSGALAFVDGKLKRLSGSVADASEQRELERSQARNEALEEFRMLFDNAPIGLYRATSDGEILRANPALLRMLGCETPERLATRAGSRLWHVRADSFNGLMQRLQTQDRIFNTEYEAALPGAGTTIRVAENTRVTERRAGGGFICEGAIQDISERHRMERELRAANAEVQKAMADRSRLFAATNHDLRQPLQSLGLFIELTRSRASDEQVLRWTDQMRAAHLSLSDTLDGLLALSRLESGKIEPDIRTIALAPLLTSLAAEYAEVAASKDVVLRAVPTRHHARTDPRLLDRILRNLIANAVRYTDQGRVLIGCRGRGADIEIQVWDTGPGIEAEAQQLIFEEFQQADAGRRAASGIGLGLAIVRGLAALMDVRVGLWSAPGRGSCFSVYLPRATQVDILQADAAGEQALQRLDGWRLLVVEDERAVREALADFLKQRGAQVATAGNLSQAQAALESHGVPDMVVLDYRLQHGETGIDCLQMLRNVSGKPIPALLVTGESAGMGVANLRDVAILRKPAAPDRLVRAICRRLQENTHA